MGRTVDYYFLNVVYLNSLTFQFALVNAVSGSLICQPDFRLGTDPTRVALVTMAEKVICYDPEFVLKVEKYRLYCLYTLLK